MSNTGNIKVYYRIFPSKNTEWDLARIEKSTIYIRSSQDLSKDKHHSKYWEYSTDGIFNNSSQETVFLEVVNDMVDCIVKGYDGIIVGFGQTGTGKSFTLGGLQFSEKEFGIIPRVIFELFNLKKQLKSNIKMSIHMTYTEFSKSNVVDLLKEFPNSIDPWHVKKATKIKVKSEFDALKLVYKGEARKTFAENDKYMSHICTSVLTFYITTANRDFTNPEKISSRLHILDMAGADSVGNASSNFKNALDVGEANIIKSYMEQFILYLREILPGTLAVKKRTNPLIYFLGNDLSNRSMLRFIGHIRIQKKDLKITVSMLRFGQFARGLRPKKKHIESEVDDDNKLQHLQSKVEHLQREKILNSVLLNQDLTTNLNCNRLEHIQRTIEAYLHGHITELSVLNVVEVGEAFKLLKTMCNISHEEERLKFQDLEARTKRGSKTSSKSSIKVVKSNTKRIKKSREGSAVGLDKTKIVKYFSNIGKRVSSPHKMSTSTPIHQRTSFVKRSKSGSIGKRSSLMRSNSSSSKEKKESKLIESVFLPDIIPEFREAWSIFTNDIKSTYKVLYEAYRVNEAEIKFVYLDYITEMADLRQCKELVEKRQHELIEARMFHQYASSDISLDVVTESVKVCQEHLDTAKMKLVEQQETVLKLQTELKIFLTKRRELKRNIREDFDEYCKEKYNTAIPIVGEEEFMLHDITMDIDLKSGEDDEKEPEDEHKYSDELLSTRFRRLQVIMKKELRKNIKLREQVNRKWKNLY